MHIVSLTVDRTRSVLYLSRPVEHCGDLTKLSKDFIERCVSMNKSELVSTCELMTRSIYCSIASKGNFFDTVKSNQNRQYFLFILGISLKIHRFASWISTARITVLLLLFAIFASKFNFFVTLQPGQLLATQCVFVQYSNQPYNILIVRYRYVFVDNATFPETENIEMKRILIPTI